MLATLDFFASTWSVIATFMIAVPETVWSVLTDAMAFAIGLFDWVPNPVEIVRWSAASGVWALPVAAAYGAGAFWIFHVRNA